MGILATTFIVATVAVEASENVHAALNRLEPSSFRGNSPAAATVAALGLIAGGSLFKIAQLAGGGTTVAERLGGRRMYPNSLDPNERRLLNVVEEMALASGVPVPPVFLLKNEQGINAFAAGFSPSDAVIGVTRGCVEQLSRDQLQGVIAHEFSHILNGDMRLNLRMIGDPERHPAVGPGGTRAAAVRQPRRQKQPSKRPDDSTCCSSALAMIVLGFLGTLLGQPHQGCHLAATGVSWPTPRPCSSPATQKASPAR